MISRDYGRNNDAGIRAVLRYAMLSMLAFSILIYLGVLFGAPQIAGIFNREHDAVLQGIAEEGLRLYFSACPFVGFNIVLSMYFTSSEHPKPAHLISILRGFLVMLPTVFLFSRIWGIRGVWCAFPAAEFIVAAVGITLFLAMKKSMRRSGKAGNPPAFLP